MSSSATGRRADAADDVVRRCVAAGRPASAVQADLSSPDGVVSLFAAIDEIHGRLDLLVNNAGVVSPAGPVSSYTADRLDAVLRTQRRRRLPRRR